METTSADQSPTDPGRRHDDRSPYRALLACGAIGGPLFVVVFLVEDAIPAIRPPGYSPLRHPVSSFALGEFGWVQIANFLVTGALLLAFAFGLRPALRHYGGGIWAPLLIGLAGAGLLGAGVFVSDPISGYPPGTPMVPDDTTRTIHGAVHDAFSTLLFLGLPIACAVVAYRFAASGHKGWATYSAGTAVAFLTSFVLTSLGFAQHPTLMPIGGLLQRLTIAIGLAWITALAVHLLSRRTRVDPSVGR